ncbi:MAG: SET domain-containing protein [Verrucomicrobiota bacterium]
MILIPVRVAPSRIHGLGLFAVGPLPRGTPVWRWVPGFDQSFSAERFAALPAVAQAHLKWFAYVDRDSGCRILSGDHACFMNHDPSPNTGLPAGSAASGTTVALRDLAAGEELTCDYRAFDAEVDWKLGQPG